MPSKYHKIALFTILSLCPIIMPLTGFCQNQDSRIGKEAYENSELGHIYNTIKEFNRANFGNDPSQWDFKTIQAKNIARGFIWIIDPTPDVNRGWYLLDARNRKKIKLVFFATAQTIKILRLGPQKFPLEIQITIPPIQDTEGYRITFRFNKSKGYFIPIHHEVIEPLKG